MTHIDGKASKDDSPILHAAISLASQIRAASEEIEHGRDPGNSLGRHYSDFQLIGLR